MLPNTVQPAATGSIIVPRNGPAKGSGRRPRWRRAAALAGLLAVVPLVWRLTLEFDPAPLREAEAAYRRGDLAGAAAKATDHLRARPWSGRAAIIAARSLTRLDRAGQAEPYYRRAGRLDADDLHLRALGLVLENRCEPAIRVYREILDRSPEDVLALRRLAGVLILQRRWHEASEVASRLIRVPSGVVIGHTLAGVVHHDSGEPEDAVVDFEHVLRLDPELRRMPLSPRLQFWVYLAVDLLAIGRPGDAQLYLRRALDEQQEAYLLDLLGRACWQQGELDEAERCWRGSIGLNDHVPVPWLLLGNLELQRDRLGEAIPLLERAAALAPAAREPVYSLSLAYRRLGRHDEADRLRDQAKRLRAGAVPDSKVTGPLPKSKT